MVDAVQAVKATSDRGDVKYPIKVFRLIFSEMIYIFCDIFNRSVNFFS